MDFPYHLMLCLAIKAGWNEEWRDICGYAVCLQMQPLCMLSRLCFPGSYWTILADGKEWINFLCLFFPSNLYFYYWTAFISIHEIFNLIFSLCPVIQGEWQSGWVATWSGKQPALTTPKLKTVWEHFLSRDACLSWRYEQSTSFPLEIIKEVARKLCNKG